MKVYRRLTWLPAARPHVGPATMQEGGLSGGPPFSLACPAQSNASTAIDCNSRRHLGRKATALSFSGAVSLLFSCLFRLGRPPFYKVRESNGSYRRAHWVQISRAPTWCPFFPELAFMSDRPPGQPTCAETPSSAAGRQHGTLF